LDHDDEFAVITASQRRAVINRLITLGAIDLEKRRGAQSEYSVIHLKREHPLVCKLFPAVTAATEPTPEPSAP
ncbi:MAG: hypothetical protein U0165_18125, partial [Polyangiaceae bacterium]